MLRFDFPSDVEEDLTNGSGQVRIRLKGERVICSLVNVVFVENTPYAVLRAVDPPSEDPIVRRYVMRGQNATVPEAHDPRSIELALAAHAASLERRSATAG